MTGQATVFVLNVILADCGKGANMIFSALTRNKKFNWHILLLLLYVIIGLTFNLLIPKTNYILVNGEYNYALPGKNLVSGNGYTLFGRPQLTFSPFFPVLVGFTYKIVGNLELAGRMVSTIAFLLSIILFFKLADFLYGKLTAHLATILFLSDRLVLEYSGTILTHSVDALLVIMIIYLVALIIKEDRFSYKNFVFLGVLFAASILNRPENIIIALAVAICLFICLKGWELKNSLKFICLIGTTIVLLYPYANFLHKHTGKWLLTTKLNRLAHFESEISEDPELVAQKRARGRVVFDYFHFDAFKYIREHKSDLIKRYSVGIKKCFNKLYHILYPHQWGIAWVLVIFGFFRKGWNKEKIKIEILLISCLSLLIIHPLGNVRERYFIYCLPIFLLWMARGLENVYLFIIARLSNFLSRKLIKTTGAVIISSYLLLIFIPKFANPALSYAYEKGPWLDYKKMGLWMKENIKDIDSKKIASRNPVVQFYLGAESIPLFVRLPFQEAVNYLRDRNTDYVIVDERENEGDSSFAFLLNDYDADSNFIKAHVIEKPGKIILYKMVK